MSNSAAMLARLVGVGVVVVLAVALGGQAARAVVITHTQGFRVPGFTGPDAAVGPVDVVVGADATMWVLDADGSLSHLVGGRLRRVTQPVSAAGRQIAVDGWGRVVQLVFRGDGVVVRRVWPDGRHSDVRLRGRNDPDPLGDVVAGPGGRVWFKRTNIGPAGVLYSGVAPDGRTLDVKSVGSYPAPAGSTLDVGPDGNLWFDSGQGVGRMTPHGRLLPWILVDPDPSSTVQRVARGSDDEMWVGVTGNVAAVRLDAKTHQLKRYSLGEEYDEDTVFWAMAPGPGARIWPLDGDFIRDEVDLIAFDEFDPIGPRGPLFKQLQDLRELPRQQSAEHYGLTAGLDGRMWFTERLFGKLEAWRSPWWKKSPRGRTRVFGAHRVGRWLRVDLGCTGTTGGYCTGTLQLRSQGQLVGRPAKYAVAAGPAAVKSRSARWLAIPHNLPPHARLTVRQRG